MNVAELFVKLGLSGVEGVSKGLKSVSEGFKDVVGSSFQAKAMIAGALYGMERMTASASKTGMELFKFAKATGLSSIELQKWQYMAGQYGAEEEVQGTIEAIQRAMAQMELGGGMPRGFALLGIDTEGKDAFQILDQLEAKVKQVSPKLGLELTAGLGINANMFQALRNINRERDKIDDRLLIYNKERDKLKDINTEWYNFWFNLNRIGTLGVGQFGSQFIGSLGNTTKILRDLFSWISKMANEFDVVKGGLLAFGTILAATFAPVATTVAGLVLLLSEIQKYREGKEGIVADLVDPTGKNKKTESPVKEALITAWDTGMTAIGMPTIRETEAQLQANAIMNNPRPIMTHNAGVGSTSNNTSTTTQIFNFDAKDMTNALSDSTKREIGSAFNLATGRAGK